MRRAFGLHPANDPEGDPASYCGPETNPLTVPGQMMCPYPTPENAARYLLGDAPDPASLSRAELVHPIGPPLVASLSVVGFAIADSEVEAQLDAIARAGGGPGARFASTGPELRAALGELVQGILARFEGN